MKQINRIKYTPGAKSEMARAEKLLPPKRHKSDGTAEVCLVIDGMNLAYMAYYAHSRLSHKGKSTAILFGLPNIIKSVLQRYKAEKIVVCWDGLKSPHRLELLPGYKGHRELKRDPKQRKRFYKEIEIVKKLLYRMGITQAYDPDIEGDDMVYMVTQKMVKLYRVIIVSADKDFHQLINWDINVYNPRTHLIHAVFAYGAGEGKEIPQLVDYQCLVGDDSDDIPGIRGIGPSRAAKFLQTYYYIDYYLQDTKAVYPGLEDKEKLAKVYKRNKLLIDLALFNKKFLRNKKITYYKKKTSPLFNDEKYRALCLKWRLNSMITENFIKFFNKV